jgi:hypothetical protein
LYGDYYRAMLWNAMPPMEQQEFLRTLLPLNIVDPQLAGFLGNRLAFPVRLDVSAEARDLIDQLITQNAEIAGLWRTEAVTLPTAAVTVETRLGMCNGCEDFIRKQRHLDVALRRAEVEQAEQRAEQEKQEALRYKARLESATPDLDDPSPTKASNMIQLVIKEEAGDS